MWRLVFPGVDLSKPLRGVARHSFAGRISTDGVAVSLHYEPAHQGPQWSARACGGESIRSKLRKGRGAKRAAAPSDGCAEPPRMRQGLLEATNPNRHLVALDPGYSHLFTAVDSQGNQGHLSNAQWQRRTLQAQHRAWYEKRLQHSGLQCRLNTLPAPQWTPASARERLAWLSEHGHAWLGFLGARILRTWRLRLHWAHQRAVAVLQQDVRNGVLLDRLTVQRKRTRKPGSPRCTELTHRQRTERRRRNELDTRQRLGHIRHTRARQRIQVCTGVGDLACEGPSPVIRGHARTPLKGLWRDVLPESVGHIKAFTARRCHARLLDEYLTSKRCAACRSTEQHLEDPPCLSKNLVRGFKRSGEVGLVAARRRAAYAYRHCAGCEQTVHRDLNAAQNLLLVLQASVQAQVRPAHLARAITPG